MSQTKETTEGLGELTRDLVALNTKILKKLKQCVELKEELLILRIQICELNIQRRAVCANLKEIEGFSEETLTPPEFSIRVQDLGFTNKTLRGLLDSKIMTLGDLLDYSESQIMQLSLFLGRSFLEEIKSVVASYGFSLKEVIVL